MNLDEADTRAARRLGEGRSRASDRLGSHVDPLCGRGRRRRHGTCAVRRSEVHRRGDVAAAREDGGKGRCKGESGQFGSSDWVYSVELTRSPTCRMLAGVARSKRSQFSSSSLPPTNVDQRWSIAHILACRHSLHVHASAYIALGYPDHSSGRSCDASSLRARASSLSCSCPRLGHCHPLSSSC